MAGQFIVRSLVQFHRDHARGIAGLNEHGNARLVAKASTTRELASQALDAGIGLAELAQGRVGAELDLSALT